MGKRYTAALLNSAAKSTGHLVLLSIWKRRANPHFPPKLALLRVCPVIPWFNLKPLHQLVDLVNLVFEIDDVVVPLLGRKLTLRLDDSMVHHLPDQLVAPVHRRSHP